jgi:hypothetical protein
VRLATIELRSKDEAKTGSRINPVQQPEEEDDVIEAVTQTRQKKFYLHAQQKTEANNSVKTPDLNNKTTVTATTSNNGGPTIQAITPTATK